MSLGSTSAANPFAEWTKPKSQSHLLSISGWAANVGIVIAHALRIFWRNSIDRSKRCSRAWCKTFLCSCNPWSRSRRVFVSRVAVRRVVRSNVPGGDGDDEDDDDDDGGGDDGDMMMVDSESRI